MFGFVLTITSVYTDDIILQKGVCHIIYSITYDVFEKQNLHDIVMT